MDIVLIILIGFSWWSVGFLLYCWGNRWKGLEEKKTRLLGYGVAMFGPLCVALALEVRSKV